jgi:hypothetical protein
VIRACPDIPHHTHAHITHKEARDQISHKYLPFTYPFGIGDIKVLSINQKKNNNEYYN